MKLKMVLAATGVALLVASPAFARSHTTHSAAAAGAFAAAQDQFYGGPYDVYSATGTYLGRDPDANVRSQLMRDGEWWQNAD